MHWRWFLPFPIAAFLCGEAVHAPRLREALPLKSECTTYGAARERYLLSYAYKKESPARAQALLEEMQNLLAECGEDPAAKILRARQNIAQ